MMMPSVALMRRAAAASRVGGGRARAQLAAVRSTDVSPGVRGLLASHALAVRQLSTAADKPLGLKAGVSGSGMTPTMRMLFGYITVALAAVATVARYKARDEEGDESVRIFNMAKRAVVKDRRVFESLGYPKEFEKIADEVEEVYGHEPSYKSGTFRIIGDKGTATVVYRQQPAKRQEVDGESVDDDAADSDVVTFDVLQVTLENGQRFSALESYMKDETTVSHKKSESLGKKLFLPVIGGVLIGGVSSFFVIRILRSRPFYVHKLVLDHVNNHEMARQWLGHPIKSNRKDYIGTLTHENANYTISCKGPKGEGTLIVKAFKKDSDGDAAASPSDSSIMATPGTAWKFSTLVLSVQRNEKRKDKHAKTINLLASKGGVQEL